MQIKIIIKTQRLTLSSNKIVCGTNNFIECLFDFQSSDWTELEKWALFKDGQNTYEMYIQDNKCIIPAQCISDQGEVIMSVVGRNNGKNITATAEDKLLLISGRAFDNPDEERLTPTYLEEVLGKVRDESLKAATSEANAAQSAQEAADSAAAALQSEKNAKASERAAETSKEAAAQSEANSKTSEDAARGYADDAEASKGAATTLAVNAAASANTAAESAKQATESEKKSAQSETNAKLSETNSKLSETNSQNSALESAQSAVNAEKSNKSAAKHSTDAGAFADNAELSAQQVTELAEQVNRDAMQVASDKKSVTELTGQAVKAAGNARTYMEQAGKIKADTQTITDSALQAMGKLITEAQNAQKAAANSESNAANSEQQTSDLAEQAASSAAQAQESAALATQKAGESANSAEQSETARAAAEMEANRAAEYAANVVENSGRYTAGVKFTPTESAGTRLDMAESMTWEKSTDLIAGRDDFPTKFNCYNTYEALVKGGKIVATEGSYEFEKYKDDDEYDADVFVMFPKGYGRRYIDGEGNEYRYISDKKLSGYVPSPLHFVENTEYNVVGITKYGWCDDGKGGICSRAGKPKRVSISWQDFETKSVARGAGIHAMNFADVTWLQHLGCIKYANRNWQSAVGNGVMSGYLAKEKCCTVSQDSASSIIVANDTAKDFTAGDAIYFSSTSMSAGIYTRKILSITDYDESNKTINVDGPAFKTIAGASGFYRAVSYSGGCDTVLGLDGEISGGVNGRKSVLTLGLENFYANDWKLLGGAFRQGTGLYVNPAPLTAPAWPSSVEDALAKGWIKFDVDFSATSGYINELSYSNSYPLISIPKTVGGNSSKPVGDYFYINSDTDLRIVLFGGALDFGLYAGPFFVYLYSWLGYARFIFGAFGVFRPQ